MLRLPPISTRTDTLFPDTTRFLALEALTALGLVDDPRFEEARRRIEDGLSWFILPNSRLAAFGDTDSLDMTKSGLVHAESSALRFATTAGRSSEEHTSELQSLMRHSYAVFCLKKKKNPINQL